MKRKIYISLFLLYFLPFLASSCFPGCDCDPPKIYEIAFNGVDLTALDTSGFDVEEIDNEAFKNAFGLVIEIISIQNEVAMFQPWPNLTSFGFASAYALSDCDCLSNEYILQDPITSIEISVTDTQTEETTVVTADFTTTNYNGEDLSIAELLATLPEFQDRFRLELSRFEDIPDSSVFTVKIVLESGAEFIQQTQTIQFI